MKPVKIIIDFNGERTLFNNPHTIIFCDRLKDVREIISMAEKYQEQGHWVVGFVSYEASYALVDLPNKNNLFNNRVFPFPLAWFGIFKTSKTIKVERKSAYFTGKLSVGKSSRGKRSYEQDISKIKQFIAKGDVYQLNYTFCKKLQYQGFPEELYEELRQKQPTKYSAFIHTPEFSVLSSSPELFFHQKGDKIVVKPMKGTASRGLSCEEDEERKLLLQNDDKNRAENIMIVDLFRNDMSRICRTGTVRTSNMLEVETHATLHQMTSTIEGQLRPGVRFREILESLFPSGSVTGAPKISAIKLIRALEQRDRKIYTGIIGFLGPEQTLFNVAIRTLLLNKDSFNKRNQKFTYKGELGVGGGITWGSTAKEEYDEALLKSKYLAISDKPFELIETMLWVHGKIFLLDLHMQRLKNSAEYFGIKFSAEHIQKVLKGAGKKYVDGKTYKVRLTLNLQGYCQVNANETVPNEHTGQIAISGKSTFSGNKFYYHKTSLRNLYDREHKKAQKAGCDDVVFFNEKGELTEGAVTNIIIQKKGRRYTPPVQCGLLPGTYRQRLLNSRRITEKSLVLKDLYGAEKVFICNSVQGLWPVKLS